MNNIKVFSLFVSIFYVFFAFPARADEIFVSPEKSFPYTFSIGASSGILYGQAEEIVYIPDTNDYWSQLLWDMKPLFYVGTALNVSRIKPMEKWGLFGDLALKFGIPGKTGVLEDRDWDSNDLHLTNFSSHNNYTQGALLLDVSFGVSVPFNAKVLFKGYVMFSYMYFSWASFDGYYQYESYKWEKKPVSGPAINYSQEWFICSFGLGLEVPFLKWFSASLDFQIGPAIQCNDQDEHLVKKYSYREQMFGGLFLEPRGGVTFSPAQNLDITLSAGWRSISGSRGQTYMRNTGLIESQFIQSGSAGAGYTALNVGLSVQVRF